MKNRGIPRKLRVFFPQLCEINRMNVDKSKHGAVMSSWADQRFTQTA